MSYKLVEPLIDLFCYWRYRRLILLHLENELDAGEKAQLENHLASCARCSARYERQTFAIHLLSGLSLDETARKLHWLRGESHRADSAPQRTYWQWLAPASVALVLALIVSIWFYQRSALSSWEVTRLTGAPTVASQRLNRSGRLTVGETLQTDKNSRAMIQVGTLGQVEVDPNTRLRLIKAEANDHRIALERGKIHAMILAPPRLFFVETPSGLAIDLGCAYSLEVNDAGESLLQVKAGWVALQLGGREELIPAGTQCRTRPGIGPGTPYLGDATQKFKTALARFDFDNGDATALQTILSEARAKDGWTLWRLLARTEEDNRIAVYQRLASLAPPPEGATREGVLNLNQVMLTMWRERLEYLSLGVDPAKAPTANGSLNPVGAMKDSRFNHTATLLNDGRVLIVGGREKEGGILTSAEIYDPATGQFTETGRMMTPRVGHTATLLPDGKVLIAGGSDKEFFSGALSSAELYDPTTGRFAPLPDMTAKRLAHKATLLKTGQVLITGGQSEEWANHASAEIFDPQKGAFTFAATMNEKRADHAATLLEDGRVLLTGGGDGRAGPITVSATAEIYDPVKNAFSVTGTMSVVRYKHSAELLPNGKVIVIGGSNMYMWEGRYASAEIFDPATGAFTPTGNLNTARYKIRDAVAVLRNGKILVAGGGPPEIYDPATGLFGTVKGGMATTRYYATATLLPNGAVLIVGGYSGESAGNMPANASAWLYQPE